jgi:predicted DNA-binding transcriptional regulator YafY
MMRAAELAQRFEVSTRTIERDLLALQEVGVPIWAHPAPVTATAST